MGTLPYTTFSPACEAEEKKKIRRGVTREYRDTPPKTRDKIAAVSSHIFDKQTALKYAECRCQHIFKDYYLPDDPSTHLKLRILRIYMSFLHDLSMIDFVCSLAHSKQTQSLILLPFS